MNADSYIPQEGDLCKEFALAEKFVEDDERTLYWRDGKVVMCGYYPVKGADPATFRSYLGGFAKDKHRCYVNGRQLTKVDLATFSVLNYCYAKDKDAVWNAAGPVKDADPATFTVLDSGFYLWRSGPGDHLHASASGYGKDKHSVFFCPYQEKARKVRKADFATFRVINENFGRDDSHVFCGITALPHSRPDDWQLLGEHYSVCPPHVYYGPLLIPEADAETLEVFMTPLGSATCAKDKNYFYDCGFIVPREEFESSISDEPPIRAVYPAGVLERAKASPRKKISCHCAHLPETVLGERTRLPIKSKTDVAWKEGCFGMTWRAATYLYKCNACGQHWQADSVPTLYNPLSFPRVCIKIHEDQLAGWQQLDDKPMRLRHFPELELGTRLENCVTADCKYPAVKGFLYCCECLSRLRSEGVDLPAKPGKSVDELEYDVSLAKGIAPAAEARIVHLVSSRFPGRTTAATADISANGYGTEVVKPPTGGFDIRAVQLSPLNLEHILRQKAQLITLAKQGKVHYEGWYAEKVDVL